MFEPRPNLHNRDQQLLLESSIIEAMLDGTATFKFLSIITQRRSVGGTEFPGSAYVYEVEVPNTPKVGETWTTEIYDWYPLPMGYGVNVTVPDRQVMIMTGRGEMPLTRNKGIENKILAQIAAQVNKE